MSQGGGKGKGGGGRSLVGEVTAVTWYDLFWREEEEVGKESIKIQIQNTIPLITMILLT